MNKSTQDYFIERAEARMNQSHQSMNRYVREINLAYKKAISELDDDIKKMVDKFSVDGELTVAEAREMLNTRLSDSQYRELKKKVDKISDETVKKKLLNKLNSQAYRARITVKEALKEDIRIRMSILSETQLETSKSAFLSVIDETYYRSLYDLQRGIGYGFNVSMMNEKIIKTVLNGVWSGKHYSKRIWSNTNVLSDKLYQTILSGFMSGKPYRMIARELDHLSKVGQYASNRLIRTECSYMVNQSELEAYKEAEIDKYKFVATLDLRTSKACQKADGKVVEVAKGKPGDIENPLPPMHPYCRSFTISYINDDWLRGAKRRAKNPVTGEYQLIPARMGYAEWKRTYVGERV